MIDIALKKKKQKENTKAKLKAKILQIIWNHLCNQQTTSNDEIEKNLFTEELILVEIIPNADW